MNNVSLSGREYVIYNNQSKAYNVGDIIKLFEIIDERFGAFAQRLMPHIHMIVYYYLYRKVHFSVPLDTMITR